MLDRYEPPTNQPWEISIHNVESTRIVKILMLKLPKSWVKKSSGHHAFLDLWRLDFIFCAWKKGIIKTYDSVNGGIRKEIQCHLSFFLVEPPLITGLKGFMIIKNTSKTLHENPWDLATQPAFKVKGSKALPRLATEDPKTRPISSQKLLEMTLMRIIPRSCEVFSPNLVGGWTNPFEKYARQFGFIFPNFRGGT